MGFFTNLKKGIASLALSALAVTILPLTAGAQLMFTDVMEIPSWAVESIEELMDQGVISGNDDGSFAPNRQLNRAEVSKIIVLATGLPIDTTGGSPFPDVNEGDWYYDYVVTMYNYGYINGYPDGLFRPGVGINRAEIAKMTVNAFELDQDLSGAPHFSDVSTGDWFYGFVETAYNAGLMRGYGDGSFGPANAVTRAETVKIVYDAQLAVMAPVGPADGTMEVVLSMDTPRGTNIPYNATSVPFLTVELTASDDTDVEVSSMTFTRLGLGDNDDFKNVWLEIDGFKVGNDKSVNNDDIVELRFNPPIVIPAGMTLMADVVASTKYTTTDMNVGHHNRFALVSADDIVSSALNVVGDFPIEGEEMEVASYEVSEIRFSALGSDTTIDVGDSFIEIGKFRMLNNSSSNKDVEVRAITFKNDGTAELEDTLESVALYVSGEQVSAETIIDGDYITFRLDNGITGGYVIEDGDSRIFSIRADVVSAERNDTINFKIDNYEDVVGVEIGTSFGIRSVAGNSGLTLGTGGTSAATCTAGTDAAEDDCARLPRYVIDSGDLNVSRDPASLGNQEYAPGSNDVVFMTSRLVVDQPLLTDGVKIRISDATVNGGAALADINARFDNFRLFLNDKLIDTENDFQNGGAVNCTFGASPDCYLDFNTTFEIAGTSILKVVGNLQDGAANGDEMKLQVKAGDFASVEYISTGDQVTDTQLLGSSVASYVKVQKSSLNIARTDGLSSGDKIVAGVDDVTFLKFVLDNNDSGDVSVTSATVVADAVNTTGAATKFSNFTAAIFVDGVQQGSAKNLDGTSGEATFNDLSVVIPSASQKEFTVVVDTLEASASSAAISVTTDAAVAPATTTTAAGTSIDLSAAGDGARANAGSTVVTLLGAGAINPIPANTTVVFDFGGTPIVRTVAQAVAATDNTIFVTEQFYADLGTDDGDGIINAADTGVTVDIAIQQYPIGSTDMTLVNASNVTVGEVLTGTGGGKCTVSAVSGNNVSCGAGTTVAAIGVGENMTGSAGTSQLQLNVKAVDADNVENGQSVEVKNGVALVSATPLAGAQFELISSGSLTTQVGTTVYSDILLGNQEEVEMMKVRFYAANDEVQIKDLFFLNDINNNGIVDGTDADVGDRVDFKIYSETGVLLQEKQMTAGTLHFELANQDRIRVPKDDSTFVTVKVDVRDISKANQTGKQLRLALDTASGTASGIEALTAATGADIAAASISGSADGENFILYRSEMSVNHAASQPSYKIPAGDQVYRFAVTADNAYDVEVGRLTFNVQLSGGLEKDTDGVAGNENLLATDLAVVRLQSDGQTETTSGASTNITDAVAGATPTTATYTVDFTVPELIAQGTTKYFAIKLSNIADLAATDDGDRVAVTISSDSKYMDPSKANAAAGGNVIDDVRANGAGDVDDNPTTVGNADAKIVWSDLSDTSHGLDTEDWLNGFLLEIDADSEGMQK